MFGPQNSKMAVPYVDVFVVMSLTVSPCPFPFFLNDFPTAVDLAVRLRLSLVPEFSCRSKAMMPGGSTCDFCFLWS